MAVDFFTNETHVKEVDLPPQLTQQHGVTTAVIGKLLDVQFDNYKNLGPTDYEHPLAKACQQEIPETEGSNWRWNYERAMVLREITSRILQRATMLMASSIVGLMLCIGSLKSKKVFNSLPLTSMHSLGDTGEEELLAIGYTGGCEWFVLLVWSTVI